MPALDLRALDSHFMATQPGGLPIYDDVGGLDPELLLRYMRSKASQIDISRSLRPGLPELGAAIEGFRLSANGAVLRGDDRDQFAPRPLVQSLEGSRAAHDAAEFAQSRLNKDNLLVLELVAESIGAISDHLWSLIALLRSDPPLRPLLATARTLLDAGVHIQYLVDESISSSERTARAANMQRDIVRQELNDIEDKSSVDALALTALRASILESGDFDGIPRAKNKNCQPIDSFDPPLVPTSTMSNFVLTAPLGQDIWRTLSSTVHARDRPFIQFLAGRGDVRTGATGIEMGINYLSPVLYVVTNAYESLAKYLGVNDIKVRGAANHVLLMAATISGMQDDELASAAGIDRTDWV